MGMLKRSFSALFAAALLAGCSSPGRAALKSEPDATTADKFNLGTHTFTITTGVPEAQAAFNRGLTLSYAFSHAAAEIEFRRAAALDPRAPMPWWGVALVNGPHINFPLVPAEKAAVAWDALLKARELRANGGTIEQDLIDALGKRYEKEQGDDRSKLDKAYAAAMKKLRAKYPTNADIGTLYVESLMDLHPWDYWTENGTKAQPWTGEILTNLEEVLALDANHPGSNHLYIHLVEASNKAARAVPSADRLRTLVPGAGHLVHMPAHIYVRVGRWEDAAKTNEDAIVADNEFRKAHPRPGFYALYMAHNHHFLSFARMMRGEYGAAKSAAEALIAGMPEDFLADFGPIADGFMAITFEVMIRFGRWEEVLATPEPKPEFPYARALWRFARATALTALDRSAEARAERAEFLRAVKKVPKESTFGNNESHTLLKVAQNVLDGEMAAREKKYDLAISFLKKAVAIEDTLKYDEPPDWIQPTRHSLGAIFLAAGKGSEAEKVYRRDLEKFPLNGWSLYGLSQALTLQGKSAEAADAKALFNEAWADSDTAIASSCLCLESE